MRHLLETVQSIGSTILVKDQDSVYPVMEHIIRNVADMIDLSHLKDFRLELGLRKGNVSDEWYLEIRDHELRHDYSNSDSSLIKIRKPKHTRRRRTR